MLSRSAIGLLLGAALATGGCDRQSAAPVQANETAAAPSPDEVAAPSPDELVAPSAPAMEAGAVDRSHKGDTPPALAFEAPDGKPVTLAGFKGKPLLVNLWATWCAPCVAELPTLDAAASAAGDTMTILAVSEDMDAAKVAPFLTAKKLMHLKPYRDPNLGLSLAYAANLPTTIFYAADGRELWRVAGGMDWTGAKAKALLAER